jgi:hypothetical protein
LNTEELDAVSKRDQRKVALALVLYFLLLMLAFATVSNHQLIDALARCIQQYINQIAGSPNEDHQIGQESSDRFFNILCRIADLGVCHCTVTKMNNPGREQPRLATLITPHGEMLAVPPKDGNAAFTKDDLDQLIKGDSKAFPLETGDLLLVDSLVCRAPNDQKNIFATCLLRHALADPGGEVCGSALLLNPEEAARLSSCDQEVLLGHPTEQATIILLLDHNDDVRSTIALGLEHRHGRVIQARTAAEAVEFCRNHAINLLVADVSSLRPQPLAARRFIQAVQPQAPGCSSHRAGTVCGLKTGIPACSPMLSFCRSPFRWR